MRDGSEESPNNMSMPTRVDIIIKNVAMLNSLLYISGLHGNITL